MSRANAGLLSAVLVAVLAILGGVAAAKGGFYIGKHEGDTLHLLQIVMRMAGGDWPHLDFQTPIGVLATAPIALFVALGAGVGHAFIYAQILVALVALPAIIWVAWTRFKGAWSFVFGIAVLVLILALVHGETERSVSVSMHYNRWAWAAAFLGIATAFLKPLGKGSALLDGLVIGLALSAMALIKMTYFVAFLPPIAVALVGRGQGRTVLVAIATGLVVAGAVTLAAGTPIFWLAYMRDLFTVMASDVRPQPGQPFGAVVGAPAYMAGSLVLLMSVIFLRQAGHKLEGLVLLLLVPGFFYVTFQNFGNDPQWIGLLGLMLAMLLTVPVARNGFGWDMGRALQICALLALAYAAPSFINLLYSPFRHMTVDVEEYAPLLPGSGVNEDMQTARIRALRVDGKVPRDLEGEPFAALSDPEFREIKTDLYGVALPYCGVELGMINWFTTVSGELVETGLVEGRSLFVADILSSFWLFGAGVPLQGASPWYYGGLPGIENADYLLVPLCAISVDVRSQVLTALEEAEVAVTEVARSDTFILYEL